MTKRSRTLLAGLLFSISCLSVGPSLAQGPAWISIQGNVQLADGTPICAMVLANGQYMFSCDGTGSYDLIVPLDGNGEITLFSFADGFAPFRVMADPENLPSIVQMQTAAPDSPSIYMSRGVECSGANRVRINGAVQSDSGQPLCALVLANGQHMFSCDASQGWYDLDVPIDEKGQVTAFGFADGFQPYSETFVAPDCSPSFPNILGTYTGSWYGSNTNCTDPNLNISALASARVEVHSQAGASFEATSYIELLVQQGYTYNGTDYLRGTLTSDGRFSGTINGYFETTPHTGTFVGNIYGNMIDSEFQTHDTVGETCHTTGWIRVSK